jgi:hypothetical protein
MLLFTLLLGMADVLNARASMFCGEGRPLQRTVVVRRSHQPQMSMHQLTLH